ncbi:MAG: hypothetical protein AAGA76_05975 [Pseudomonadota bacterium]
MTRFASAVLVFLASFLGFTPGSQNARAFDAGHHFDLTRVTLKQQGLGPDAINSIIMANWLTDYYSTAPVVKNLFLKPALNRLHFDNLTNRQEVENYHGWLMHNTKMLVQEAARENDRIKLLTVMGMAHHVIQDFYSHSNWVELYPRQNDGTFDISLFPTRNFQPARPLRTGSWPEGGQFGHGGYTSGLNKDSHVRPEWENAFVMAHAATLRLTEQIRNWVEEIRPGFWQHASTLNITPKNRNELLRDLKSAHDISMWVKARVLGLPAADGHWKGNLSGDSGKFATANNAFLAWKNSFITRYFRDTDVAARMALNLEKPEPPEVRQSRLSNNLESKAVVVKIHSFEIIAGGNKPVNTGARITINGEPYLGRVFTGQASYAKSAIPAWHEIHVGAENDEDETVKIEVALFAYDSDSSRATSQLDINEDPASLGLLLESPLNTGVLTTAGNGSLAATITYSVEIHEID